MIPRGTNTLKVFVSKIDSFDFKWIIYRIYLFHRHIRQHKIPCLKNGIKFTFIKTAHALDTFVLFDDGLWLFLQ